jgi:hypothetical protein
VLVRRDVEVEVQYLTREAGGRQTPVRSGYRPQFHYEGRDWDAAHEYPDVTEVRPGERARAFLALLSPEEHDGRLVPGTQFEFREGARIVAIGTVTRVLDLPNSAYIAKLRAAIESYYRSLVDLAESVPAGGQRVDFLKCIEPTLAIRRDVMADNDAAIPEYVQAERHRRASPPFAGDVETKTFEFFQQIEAMAANRPGAAAG